MSIFRTLFGRSVARTIVDVSDPLVATKLGIADHEWTGIRQQATKEAGWAMVDVEKVSSSVIEVRFKSPNDRGNDAGGIFHRYERKRGVWKRRPIFGNWAVGYCSK